MTTSLALAYWYRNSQVLAPPRAVLPGRPCLVAKPVWLRKLNFAVLACLCFHVTGKSYSHLHSRQAELSFFLFTHL